MKKATQQWAAVMPGKISEGRKQPYKASIDLWLVVLRGPMQSIIDLAAIIQRPAWNKEKHQLKKQHPTLPTRYEKITSLKPVKWREKKKRGCEEGENGGSRGEFPDEKQQLCCPVFFSASLFLSGQQQNEQIDGKGTVKSH